MPVVLNPAKVKLVVLPLNWTAHDPPMSSKWRLGARLMDPPHGFVLLGHARFPELPLLPQ